MHNPDLAIAPVRLRHIIGVYANGDGYLINMVEGAPRVGLDGEAAGVVVAGDAEHARRKLRKQVEQRKRKAARIASNTQTEGSQPSAQAAARPLPPPSGGRVGLVGLKTAALARKGFLSAP